MLTGDGEMLQYVASSSDRSRMKDCAIVHPVKLEARLATDVALANSQYPIIRGMREREREREKTTRHSSDGSQNGQTPDYYNNKMPSSPYNGIGKQ